MTGKTNIIADSLSRFQINRFREVAKKADQMPAQVPIKFLDLISKMR
jgi:hypothetical protein